MLDGYQIAVLCGISAKHYCPVKYAKNAFPRSGAQVCTGVSLPGIECAQDYSFHRAVEYQSVGISTGSNVGQVLHFLFFVLLTKLASLWVMSIKVSARRVVNESMDWMVSALMVPRKMSWMLVM